MSIKIAVSDSLSPVKKLLHFEGYNVLNIENESDLSDVVMEDYDAIIVSGMDDNMMGMQDISGQAMVINASGKSPDEILDELQSRLDSYPME